MAVLTISLAGAQTEVGDATLPNTMSLEGADLVLNGAGLREKLWIDLYAGGLYLPSKSSDAKLFNSFVQLRNGNHSGPKAS